MTDWEGRLATFEGSLPERIARFVAWQTERWPRLREGRAALERVRVRDLEVDGRRVRLQWNPGRTASSTAKVEPAAVAARPCFLCPHALPPEEAGFAWGEDLVVLPNPAPILDPHLVIAHRRHVPQDVFQALAPLVAFAVEAPGYTVLYNGPRCGASAPDHLHLQAVPAGILPEEAPGNGVPLADGVRRGGRGYVFEGAPDTVRERLATAIEVLADATSPGEEPMLNLLATARGDGVRAVLFPRGRHRPACYFDEGPGRRVVSPGVVDIAGVVVLVRAEDYDALDGTALAGIFREVALPEPAREAWDAALRRRWSDG